METLAKFSELLTVPNKNTSLGRIIVLFFLITFFFTSCENKSYNIISEEEKKQTDSIVYANKNEESLRKLISQFKESGNSYGEIISYKELGRILREKSSFIKSIDIHKKGLDKAIQVKDTIQIVQALNNIATNYRRMGVLDEAAVFHYQALALCNAYSDKESEVARKNRVVSLNGIGNIHMTMQNYEIADSVLHQALAGEQSLGSDLGQAINYANLGYIFEARTQMDSALYYYQQSMKHNRLAKSDLALHFATTTSDDSSKKQTNLIALLWNITAPTTYLLHRTMCGTGLNSACHLRECISQREASTSLRNTSKKPKKPPQK